MISPRRSAQYGLLAAALILVSSVFILVAGANNQPAPRLDAVDQPAVQQHAGVHTSATVQFEADSATAMRQ